MEAFLGFIAGALLASLWRRKGEKTQAPQPIIRLSGWGKTRKSKAINVSQLMNIRNPAHLPYRSASYLLTRIESRFYEALLEATKGRYLICPKVRLADVVRCCDAKWSEGYGQAISQLHLDFVLIYQDTSKIACAVELDDSTHRRPARAKRDAWVDTVLECAEVPLVRRSVREHYDVSKIKGPYLREGQQAQRRPA